MSVETRFQEHGLTAWAWSIRLGSVGSVAAHPPFTSRTRVMHEGGQCQGF